MCDAWKDTTCDFTRALQYDYEDEDGEGLVVQSLLS